MKKILFVLVLLASLVFAASGGSGGGGGGSSAPTPTPIVLVSCVDSDDGKMPNAAGTVTLSYSDNSSKTFSDSCDNNESLSEYYCDEKANAARLVYNCLCSGGACVPATPSATMQPTVVSQRKLSACENLASRRERVTCRVSSKESDDAFYTPEECRKKEGESKERCLKAYADTKKCFEPEKDEERFACARKVLGVGEISAMKKTCNGEKECLRKVKQNVFWMVKFRFYNLEEKAEELIGKGALASDVAVLADALEQLKEDFNNAKSVAEKKEIVKKARGEWQKFLQTVKI